MLKETLLISTNLYFRVPFAELRLSPRATAGSILSWSLRPIGRHKECRIELFASNPCLFKYYVSNITSILDSFQQFPMLISCSLMFFYAFEFYMFFILVISSSQFLIFWESTLSYSPLLTSIWWLVIRFTWLKTKF